MKKMLVLLVFLLSLRTGLADDPICCWPTTKATDLEWSASLEHCTYVDDLWSNMVERGKYVVFNAFAWPRDFTLSAQYWKEDPSDPFNLILHTDTKTVRATSQIVPIGNVLSPVPAILDIKPVEGGVPWPMAPLLLYMEDHLFSINNLAEDYGPLWPQYFCDQSFDNPPEGTIYGGYADWFEFRMNTISGICNGMPHTHPDFPDHAGEHPDELPAGNGTRTLLDLGWAVDDYMTDYPEQNNWTPNVWGLSVPWLPDALTYTVQRTETPLLSTTYAPILSISYVIDGEEPPASVPCHAGTHHWNPRTTRWELVDSVGEVCQYIRYATEGTWGYAITVVSTNPVGPQEYDIDPNPESPPMNPLLEGAWFSTTNHAPLPILSTIMGGEWASPPLLRSHVGAPLPSLISSSQFVGIDEKPMSHPTGPFDNMPIPWWSGCENGSNASLIVRTTSSNNVQVSFIGAVADYALDRSAEGNVVVQMDRLAEYPLVWSESSLMVTVNSNAPVRIPEPAQIYGFHSIWANVATAVVVNVAENAPPAFWDSLSISMPEDVRWMQIQESPFMDPEYSESGGLTMGVWFLDWLRDQMKVQTQVRAKSLSNKWAAQNGVVYRWEGYGEHRFFHAVENAVAPCPATIIRSATVPDFEWESTIGPEELDITETTPVVNVIPISGYLEPTGRQGWKYLYDCGVSIQVTVRNICEPGGEECPTVVGCIQTATLNTEEVEGVGTYTYGSAGEQCSEPLLAGETDSFTVEIPVAYPAAVLESPVFEDAFGQSDGGNLLFLGIVANSNHPEYTQITVTITVLGGNLVETWYQFDRWNVSLTGLPDVPFFPGEETAEAPWRQYEFRRPFFEDEYAGGDFYGLPLHYLRPDVGGPGFGREFCVVYWADPGSEGIPNAGTYSEVSPVGDDWNAWFLQPAYHTDECKPTYTRGSKDYQYAYRQPPSSDDIPYGGSVPELSSPTADSDEDAEGFDLIYWGVESGAWAYHLDCDPDAPVVKNWHRECD